MPKMIRFDDVIMSYCIRIQPREVITHPCRNFNGGYDQPLLKLDHESNSMEHYDE